MTPSFDGNNLPPTTRTKFAGNAFTLGACAWQTIFTSRGHLAQLPPEVATTTATGRFLPDGGTRRCLPVIRRSGRLGARPRVARSLIAPDLATKTPRFRRNHDVQQSIDSSSSNCPAVVVYYLFADAIHINAPCCTTCPRVNVFPGDISSSATIIINLPAFEASRGPAMFYVS